MTAQSESNPRQPQPPQHTSNGHQSPPRPRQQPGSACEECRKRKLRCDRQQPQCGVCADSGVRCHIRTSCPPRGPKKGHLKVLRSQIAALESRLDNQERGIIASANTIENAKSNLNPTYEHGPASAMSPPLTSAMFAGETWPVHMPTSDSQIICVPASANPRFDTDTGPSAKTISTSSARICLTDIMCIDLDQLYFEHVHPFAPFIHQGRYQSWTKQQDKTKMQLCLQNAMWILTASLLSQARYVRDLLYAETRQMLDAVDTDDDKYHSSGLQCIQAWLLIAIHEMMNNNCQRGLLSVGRALRLIQLHHMYEIDKPNTMCQIDVSRDWVEAESARRTFWLAYVFDRFIGLNEGLPLTLTEQEIRTRLPATEAQFQNGQPHSTSFLSEFLAASVARKVSHDKEVQTSPLTECILVATNYSRSLSHKERTTDESSTGFSMQDFRRRHEWLDSVVAGRIKALSMRNVRLVFESPDPCLMFATLAAHTNVLFLCTIIESISMANADHQQLLEEYGQRASVAVQEICRMATTLISFANSQIHPLMPIPLLQCARFVLAHPDLSAHCQLQLQDLNNALKTLKNVNSLSSGDYLDTIQSSGGVGVGVTEIEQRA